MPDVREFRWWMATPFVWWRAAAVRSRFFSSGRTEICVGVTSKVAPPQRIHPGLAERAIRRR